MDNLESWFDDYLDQQVQNLIPTEPAQEKAPEEPPVVPHRRHPRPKKNKQVRRTVRHTAARRPHSAEDEEEEREEEVSLPEEQKKEVPDADAPEESSSPAQTNQPEESDEWDDEDVPELLLLDEEETGTSADNEEAPAPEPVSAEDPKTEELPAEPAPEAPAAHAPEEDDTYEDPDDGMPLEAFVPARPGEAKPAAKTKPSKEEVPAAWFVPDVPEFAPLGIEGLTIQDADEPIEPVTISAPTAESGLEERIITLKSKREKGRRTVPARSAAKTAPAREKTEKPDAGEPSSAEEDSTQKRDLADNPLFRRIDALTAKHGSRGGLRGRWLINSMWATILIMIIMAAVSIALISDYCYGKISGVLENETRVTAALFSGTESEAAFATAADSFDFDTEGNIILELLGPDGTLYASSEEGETRLAGDGADIEEAVESGEMTNWSGRDETSGKRASAVSLPVVRGDSVIGIVRASAPLSTVDRQVLLLSMLVLAVAAVVLVITYLSSLYCVRSILGPIAEINEATRRIASGSYGAQLDMHYDDEIGELADTINDMSHKLGQTEKMKSEFISSVSHELRTPLTAINGWGETLLSGEVTEPREVQKGLSIIVSEAKRLTGMVEELLEFSRIEDGRFTLNIETVDIKAELEDAVYTYREFFRKKGINLEYSECEEEFPPIAGDPQRLRQVFSNLLDNAAKHGGDGRRISVSIYPDGEFAAIRIRDYGPGIPENELPYVKTKFFKGSSKARGSGIGLAVCDEIAIRHNGSLEIGNASGGGCAAILRLPVHES